MTITLTLPPGYAPVQYHELIVQAQGIVRDFVRNDGHPNAYAPNGEPVLNQRQIRDSSSNYPLATIALVGCKTLCVELMSDIEGLQSALEKQIKEFFH